MKCKLFHFYSRGAATLEHSFGSRLLPIYILSSLRLRYHLHIIIGLADSMIVWIGRRIFTLIQFVSPQAKARCLRVSRESGHLQTRARGNHNTHKLNSNFAAQITLQLVVISRGFGAVISSPEGS